MKNVSKATGLFWRADKRAFTGGGSRPLTDVCIEPESHEPLPGSYEGDSTSVSNIISKNRSRLSSIGAVRIAFALIFMAALVVATQSVTPAAGSHLPPPAVESLVACAYDSDADGNNSRLDFGYESRGPPC